MKLTNIKICGIRGFNTEKEINLDEGLTMIYGQNGQGKTSFVEAIEWLLFGTIFKKDKAPSKVEYRDTIKNLHFAKGTPYVEAIFSNGSDPVKLRREYVNEDWSRFFINDAKSDGICDLGLCDIIRPIIYQHGLKSFIHTEPVGRFKEFMRLLNIDDVDQFFRKVRDAQNAYWKSKPKRIRDALLFLNRIEDEQKDYYDFLISNNFDILVVSNKINNEVKVCKTEITEGNFKSFCESVQTLTEKVKKELFDLEIFSPILTFKPLDKDFLEKPEILEAVKVLVNPEVRLAKNRLETLKNGLEIIEKTKTKECPLCFEKTITDDKIGYIREKYLEDSEFKRRIKHAQTQLESYLEEISQWKRTYSELFKKVIIDEKKMEPCKNLEINGRLLTDFDEKTKLLNQKFRETYGNTESLGKMLDNLQNMVIGETDKVIDDFSGMVTNLKGNFKNLNEIVSGLSKITGEIKTGLANKISSSDKVKRYEIILYILQNTKNLRILQIDAEIEETLKTSIKDIKEYRDGLLNRLLSSHKSKIIEWYNTLNPKEDVCIHDIDCQGDKVNFVASSYGVKRHAVPILSEAHLNCLGLSIYLSKIVNPDNPFSFIFIDDPVQSMDSMHTDYFINDVVQKLVEKNYQIFILSHLHKKVYEQVLNKYKELTPTPMEFYGCTIEGPKIEIKGQRFEGYISLADQNYNGNVEQRKTAANMIRQALEAYAKEYYCKKSGEEIPDSYKKETFKVLDDKLLSRVEIDTHERGKLRNIGRNCDRASHDDLESEPPSSDELRSYIDTLKSLYRKHIKGVS
jgi:hypothetical protein